MPVRINSAELKTSCRVNRIQLRLDGGDHATGVISWVLGGPGKRRAIGDRVDVVRGDQMARQRGDVGNIERRAAGDLVLYAEAEAVNRLHLAAPLRTDNIAQHAGRRALQGWKVGNLALAYLRLLDDCGIVKDGVEDQVPLG